jgi:hypothetical protein
MPQLSVAVRNARLDAIETTTGASPLLRVFTGTMPANCAAASTGTQLAQATLPADWMAAAASGSKALSGTWQDAAADASGLAGYYRILDSAGTTCHVQGTTSQPWAISTAYALNQQAHNGGNVYRVTTAGTSAGSGGPTGTGTGITDGTVTWNYVGPLDMAIDNTNFATGQPFNVTTYTLTDGNA